MCFKKWIHLNLFFDILRRQKWIFFDVPRNYGLTCVTSCNAGCSTRKCERSIDRYTSLLLQCLFTESHNVPPPSPPLTKPFDEWIPCGCREIPTLYWCRNYRMLTSVKLQLFLWENLVSAYYRFIMRGHYQASGFLCCVLYHLFMLLLPNFVLGYSSHKSSMKWLIWVIYPPLPPSKYAVWCRYFNQDEQGVLFYPSLLRVPEPNQAESVLKYVFQVIRL